MIDFFFPHESPTKKEAEISAFQFSLIIAPNFFFFYFAGGLMEVNKLRFICLELISKVLIFLVLSICIQTSLENWNCSLAKNRACINYFGEEEWKLTMCQLVIRSCRWDIFSNIRISSTVLSFKYEKLIQGFELSPQNLWGIVIFIV